jgi:FtsZ-interacting cell division protein ZipA
MTRRFETGNVVGFVLVGVLLTAMLVGGVWLARHPAGSSSSQTTSQTTSTDKTADTANKTTTDEELKQTLAQQAAEAAEAKQNNSSSTSSSTSTSSTKLPTTGPADTLIETVGAMLLVGTFVAYVRSRSLA